MFKQVYPNIYQILRIHPFKPIYLLGRVKTTILFLNTREL